MTEVSEKLQKKIDKILEKHKDNEIYSTLEKITLKLIHGKVFRGTEKTYREIAELTSKINFKCHFDGDAGTCKKNKHRKMCCCSSCRNNVGYLSLRHFSVYDNIREIEDHLLYYAKKFNNESGFWKEGEGCVLPRTKRSITCLTYHCNNNLLKEEKLIIDVLRELKHSDKRAPGYLYLIVAMLKDYFLYRADD